MPNQKQEKRATNEREKLTKWCKFAVVLQSLFSVLTTCNESRFRVPFNIDDNDITGWKSGERKKKQKWTNICQGLWEGEAARSEVFVYCCCLFWYFSVVKTDVHIAFEEIASGSIIFPVRRQPIEKATKRATMKLSQSIERKPLFDPNRTNPQFSSFPSHETTNGSRAQLGIPMIFSQSILESRKPENQNNMKWKFACLNGVCKHKSSFVSLVLVKYNSNEKFCHTFPLYIQLENQLTIVPP